MPLYVYACEADHETEVVCSIEARPDRLVCPDCGAPTERKMCAPALHTLATFARDIRDEGVQRTLDADGSYCDPNLFDRRTGKHPRIRSKAHREEVMKELGVHELPPSDVAKDADSYKRRKPLYFS